MVLSTEIQNRHMATFFADMPSDVKELLAKGVQWLTINTLSGKYKAWNAFFSGSGKGLGVSSSMQDFEFNTFKMALIASNAHHSKSNLHVTFRKGLIFRDTFYYLLAVQILLKHYNLQL